MYSYIKGHITEIFATHITMECLNIGYLVRVPNPYQFELKTELILYVHLHVREDAMELFGFATKAERSMFENLISVKGLGPKGALAILASSTPMEIITALENSHAKYFTNFPGIGPKLSQQIILDLKGKVNFEENTTSANKANEKLENVMVALKALGYNVAEIKNATKDLLIDDTIPLSDAVKQALRKLKRN